MKLFRQAILAIVALLVSATLVGAQDKWHPSKWGANDEIGSANYMTPDLVMQAAKLVKKGKVYSLGVPVDDTTPAFPPRGCKVIIVQPGQQQNGSLGPTKTTYNDDILNCWVGIGSQIDGLGHIGVDNIYYNGNKASDFAAITGLKKLGIEKVPPLVGRAVVLDMAGLMGVDIVKEGTPFNSKEIESAQKRQNVTIKQGDIVLFYSGWINLLGKDNKRYGSVEPGLGLDGAKYLTGKGVLAVGADTWGLEVVPFEKGVGVFEVHQWLLPKNGTYILETMDTREMVKDKVWEALFVLGHSKYVGAVQAMINPIAIH